jgi:hypothetical protein
VSAQLLTVLEDLIQLSQLSLVVQVNILHQDNFNAKIVHQTRIAQRQPEILGHYHALLQHQFHQLGHLASMAVNELLPPHQILCAQLEL